jgi:hypothetical protein
MTLVDINDPEFIWQVWKTQDGRILGPSIPIGIKASVTYAKLDDLGNWIELPRKIPIE